MDSTISSIIKCAFCGYESTRSFNVFRHEDRIHRKPKHHRKIQCCNKRFRTKGELYAHVEQNHPETRKGLVSRLKYKILKPFLETYNLKAKHLKTGQKRRGKIPSISSRKLKEGLSYLKCRIAEPVFRTYNLRSKSEKQETAKIDANIQRKLSLRIQKRIKKEKHTIDMDNTILESFQPVFQQSSKRKFEEIDETVDYNFKKEQSCTNSLPIKKKILRELQENVLSGGEEEKMVSSGSYPFRITLPDKLPCSFEALYGRVRYSINATFVITSELKFSTNPIPFTVVSTVDLNCDSLASLPISENLSKTFMGQSDPLTVAVSFPVRGFVPGQTIPVKINVKNESNVDVKKLRIIFKKVVTYHATEKSRKHKEVIVEIQQPVSKNTELYEVGVDIPSVPPTGMIGCKIINVIYTLKVEVFVDINEWYYKIFHKNLKIRMPIIIGTIPLKNYENPQNTDLVIKEERSSNVYENINLSPSSSLIYEESKIYRSSKPNKDDPTGDEGDSDGEVEPYFPMYRVYKFDRTKKRGGTS